MRQLERDTRSIPVAGIIRDCADSLVCLGCTIFPDAHVAMGVTAVLLRH